MSASYLTVKEAASALGISPDAVRKHIRSGKLPAIKRSERNTMIPRPAFDAYVRRLNAKGSGEPLGRAVPVGTLSERLAEFVAQAGKAPEPWLADWVADSKATDDTSKSMELAIAAVGLIAEQRAQSTTAVGDSAPEPAFALAAVRL